MTETDIMEAAENDNTIPLGELMLRNISVPTTVDARMRPRAA